MRGEIDMFEHDRDGQDLRSWKLRAAQRSQPTAAFGDSPTAAVQLPVDRHTSQGAAAEDAAGNHSTNRANVECLSQSTAVLSTAEAGGVALLLEHQGTGGWLNGSPPAHRGVANMSGTSRVGSR